MNGDQAFPNDGEQVINLPSRPAAAPDFDVKKINECNRLKGEILELKAKYDALRISVRDAVEPIGNHVTLEKYGDKFADLKLTVQQLHAIHAIYRATL